MDTKIRNLTKDDKKYLLKWLTDPEVLAYYEGRDQTFHDTDIERKFYNSDPINRMILEYQGEPIGYMQSYLLDSLEYQEYGYSDDLNVMGIDLFIGIPSLWNHGLGTKFITLYLNTIPSTIDYVVLDPLVFNTRSIRCYEKSGFHKKKRLRAHELHEGVWQDAWLMEYVVEK